MINQCQDRSDDECSQKRLFWRPITDNKLQYGHRTIGIITHRNAVALSIYAIRLV